jgi:hypothetical protein
MVADCPVARGSHGRGSLSGVPAQRDAAYNRPYVYGVLGIVLIGIGMLLQIML